MNLFTTIFSVLFLFSSITYAIAPGDSCNLPFSMATQIVTIKSITTLAPTPNPTPGPFAPPVSSMDTETTPAVKAATVGSSLGSALSVFSAYSPTQVAQGPRALLEFQILMGHNVSALDQTSLPWLESPTQLSIGSSKLHNYLGAVVGNWALLGGAASLWVLTAAKLGTEQSRFPGGLAWPVLFLTSSTTSSAVTLLQEGTLTEQLVGGCSITAQVIGAGVIAVFLHPTNFKAEWVSNTHDWADAGQAGYVKRYGLLFHDFREGRHWFITAELLMSMATGVLKSYLDTGSRYEDVLAVSAAASTGYALSMLVLHPHQSKQNSIFYGGVAGVQALALTTQAIALGTGSEETQEKTRRVTEVMIMATQWALTLKSLFDFGLRIKSLYINRFSPVLQTGLGDYLINDGASEVSIPGA